MEQSDFYSNKKSSSYLFGETTDRTPNCTTNVFNIDSKGSTRMEKILKADDKYVRENSMINLDIPQWCLGEFLKDAFRLDEKVI